VAGRRRKTRSPVMVGDTIVDRGLLFVDVVERNKTPTLRRQTKCEDDDFIAGFVFTSDAELFRMPVLNFGLRRRKTLCGIRLFVEDFAIASEQLRLATDLRYAV